MVEDARKIRVSMGTFDLIKGLAMILIVLAHMKSHYDLGTLIPKNLIVSMLGFVAFILDAGVNPLFFIIRGFSFKAMPVGKMLRKTYSVFFKPYIYTMLAVAVLFPVIYCLQYGFGLGAFKQAARWVLAFLFGLHDPLAKQKVILGIEVRACWVAWFLLTMFVSSNVFNLIMKFKNRATQIALTVLSVLAGYALSLVDFTYFCLPQGLIAAGYCYVGYFFMNTNFFERSSAVKLGTCLVLLSVAVLEALFGGYNLAYNTYKYGLLEIVGTSCVGVLLLILGVYAGQCKWKGLDWIKQIGIYTFWIMCIHSVELICLPWKKIIQSMPDHPLLAFSIEIVLKVLIYMVSCAALKKISLTKYRRMKLKNGA